MDIEMVVFDIAGTTVNDEDSVNRCLRDALKSAGISAAAAEINRVMGIPKPEAIAMLISREGKASAPAHTVSTIHADFVARSIAFYEHDPSVREVLGATSVFEKLHASGIRVALDTGFNRSITRVILDRLGWSESGLIDAVVSSDEVARGRPHPDMILELMSRLGVAITARVAKVGDTPSDLHEGQNARCGLIIGVTQGTHTREELEAHPHTHLIPTIAELPGILGLGSS